MVAESGGRPYVVCHIFMSVDGKISGDFMSDSAALPARNEYGRLRSVFECDAMVYGATTMVESYGAYDTKGSKPSDGERSDFVAPHEQETYMVSIDGRGTVAYKSGAISRGGRPPAHVIEVLTDEVSDAYLEYLRGKGVSYVFAGSEEVDCAEALRKLSALFGIKRAMVAGGGKVDQSFLASGCMDELSLVVAPVAASDHGAVSVFEPLMGSKDAPTPLELRKVEKLDGGAVWLRYGTKA